MIQRAKILGYGDYQIRNVTISRVTMWKDLDTTYSPLGIFFDSNLEVAFYMTASSLICLLSKASKIKSWLWHRRLPHLNFGEINHLAIHGPCSSGPALHEMTPVTISSGLMPNPPSSTPFIPPLRTNWDLLFQPLFNELLTPPPTIDHPTPKVIALIAEVVAQEPAVSTGSPSSTTVDSRMPPSPINSQTTP
ncbi:hypothetical protein Tco_0493364 [Tanacetum coccineum]